MSPDVIDADRPGADSGPPFGRAVLGQRVDADDAGALFAAPIGPDARVIDIGIGVKEITAVRAEKLADLPRGNAIQFLGVGHG